MEGKPNFSEGTELNGVHLSSLDLMIKVWIYNKSHDYFLAENIDLLKDGPMDYIDYHFEDVVYANKKISDWSREDGHWYTISMLDSLNKYSLNYFNCTWIVAIWTSKKNWKNLSFLTHQDPKYFLSDEESIYNEWDTRAFSFKKYLRRKLKELKDESVEWTIDIIILWWNNNDNFEEYKKSITFLSEVVYNIIWINPVVVWWPSVNEIEDSIEKWIFVDTKNRRVYYYKKHNHIWSNIVCVSNDVDRIVSNINTWEVVEMV